MAGGAKRPPRVRLTGGAQPLQRRRHGVPGAASPSRGAGKSGAWKASDAGRRRGADTFIAHVRLCDGTELNTTHRALDFSDARRQARKAAEKTFPGTRVESVSASRLVTAGQTRTTAAGRPVQGERTAATVGTQLRGRADDGPAPSAKAATSPNGRTGADNRGKGRKKSRQSAAPLQCRECLQAKPAYAFPQGNLRRCLDCGGQDRGVSVRAISGGLPGLGKRR